MTDAGRKVYGGDGITPDYCVEPETPTKFVSSLISRRAFLDFSRGFATSESTGVAKIAGTGSRSEVAASKVKLIGRDFQVDDKVLVDFKAFLETRKLTHTPADLQANREALSREIQEEVLRQVFGEGEARKRMLSSDPQVKKALELVPKAELLLRDAPRSIAEREAEGRTAAALRH